jgi:hypothetical protein
MGHGQGNVEREEDHRRRDEEHQQARAEREVAVRGARQLDQERRPSRSSEQKKSERQGRLHWNEALEPDGEQRNEDEVRDQGPEHGARFTERREDLPEAVREPDRQHAAHGEDEDGDIRRPREDCGHVRSPVDPA